jgi:hypothetical protein
MSSSPSALHTSAYVSIRQQTSAYISIRQAPRWQRRAGCPRRPPRCIRQHTSAYVSIRQHTSGCVRIREDTSGYATYVSIREDTHTSAYVRIRYGCSTC